MRLVVCTPCGLFADVLAAALRPHGHAVTAASSSPAAAARAAVGTGAAACLLDTRPPADGRPARPARDVRAVTALAPHCAVVLLADTPSPAHVPGAVGTVPATASVARVARTLDHLVAGRPLPPTSVPPSPTRPTPAHHRLTPRESAVLRCLDDGQTPDQIARRLGVAHSTVRAHIGHMLAKLGAHGTREAVALTHRP